MIEIDIDPNFPDRRPGVTKHCVVATNRDIRDGHTIDELEIGMAVTVVQPSYEDDEPDFIAPATVDGIRDLGDNKFGISHFIYLETAKEDWHDRPEA